MDDLVQLGSLGASSSSVFETDPVCKMKVMPETAAGSHKYKGRTYYFCSRRCVERFRANPDQFLVSSQSAIRNLQSEISKAVYTCPMHPQIRQAGPGACPICGMALEPEMATAASGESAELRDMRRRFWISLALAVPVFALEMGGHVTGAHTLLAQSWSNWVQLFLASPVVLWGGSPFFVRAGQSL